jgi:hypothetical protein
MQMLVGREPVWPANVERRQNPNEVGFGPRGIVVVNADAGACAGRGELSDCPETSIFGAPVAQELGRMVQARRIDQVDARRDRRPLLRVRRGSPDSRARYRGRACSDEFTLPQDQSHRAADQHSDGSRGATRRTLRSFIEAYRELTAIDRDVMFPPA